MAAQLSVHGSSESGVRRDNWKAGGEGMRRGFIADGGNWWWTSAGGGQRGWGHVMWSNAASDRWRRRATTDTVRTGRTKLWSLVQDVQTLVTAVLQSQVHYGQAYEKLCLQRGCIFKKHVLTFNHVLIMCIYLIFWKADKKHGYLIKDRRWNKIQMWCKLYCSHISKMISTNSMLSAKSNFFVKKLLSSILLPGT